MRRLADDDPHGRSYALQAGGGVHRVAHHEAVTGQRVDVEMDERAPGVDADAGADDLPAGRRQLRQPLQDPQAGAHGTLGIVLVRDRDAEDGDDGVADELLDEAAERGRHLPDERAEGQQQLVDVLRVGPFADGGEAAEVAEQSRDDSAL